MIYSQRAEYFARPLKLSAVLGKQCYQKNINNANGTIALDRNKTSSIFTGCDRSTILLVKGYLVAL